MRSVSAGRYTRFPTFTACVRTRTENSFAVTDREAHRRQELVYTAQHEKGNLIHRRDHISLVHIQSYFNVQSMVHPLSVPNPDLRSSRITSAVLPVNTTLPLPSPCTTHTLTTRSFGYPYPATRCIPTRSFGCPQCSHPVLTRTILSPDLQSYPYATYSPPWKPCRPRHADSTLLSSLARS